MSKRSPRRALTMSGRSRVRNDETNYYRFDGLAELHCWIPPQGMVRVSLFWMDRAGPRAGVTTMMTGVPQIAADLPRRTSRQLMGHNRTQTAFPITRRSGSPSIPHRLSQIKARITGARRASLRSAQAMLPSARTAASHQRQARELTDAVGVCSLLTAPRNRIIAGRQQCKAAQYSTVYLNCKMA
jgi:hypothetical protein